MKQLSLLILALLVCVAAHAIPASPFPFTVTQPDGSQITVKINGDEFYNFYTTLDGYTIIRNENGAYEYATKYAGKLVSSGIIAHNDTQRSNAENAFLATVSKRIIDEPDSHNANNARRARAQEMKAKKFDYSNFKGLILLVEFNDCSFTRSDVKDFYQRMINEENYTGYTNEDGSSNYYGRFPGSVRDYFYDNSYGEFAPTFDVIGPIKINYSVDYANQTSNIRNLLTSALTAADNDVDYSQYDLDKDGAVDMFYVIFAGVGSNTDEAPKHVWPHASTLIGYSRDGVRLSRYACSCELLSESAMILDGIGTMCHEFSHVLGLPDLYDTNYATNGQAVTPSEFEIMDGGGYNNYGRTPAGYSAYDKYSIGFINPTVISEPGEFSLQPLNASKDAFIIKTPVNKEYFILENRQQTRWDEYIPGHGMLVARVDSTNASAWASNDVNINPNHLYYEILRAGNSTVSGGAKSDPFPGSSNNSFITNATSPSLKTWTQKENELNIIGINESNGVISFRVFENNTAQADVETFETMAATTNTGLKDVEGIFTTWSFTKCNVTAPGEGKCTDTQSVAMKLPSQILSGDTNYDAYMLTLTAYNTTLTTASLTLAYSDDEGASWKTVKTVSGENTATIEKSAVTTPAWPLNVTREQNVRYRITQSAGNKNSPFYIDDVTLYYTAKGKDDTIKGDVDRNGVVNVSDVTTLVNMILGIIPIDKDVADVDGNGEVNVSDVTELVNIILNN